MSDDKMREAFEAKHPRPKGVMWDAVAGMYCPTMPRRDYEVEAIHYQTEWLKWEGSNPLVTHRTPEITTKNGRKASKPPQRQGNDPLLFEFGHGDKVVDVGTYGDKHAVFIAPVVNGPGPVGVSSIDSEPQINDRLIDGEKVMTFPTSEQAHAVCDALANKIGQRQGGESVSRELLENLDYLMGQVDPVCWINRRMAINAHHEVRRILSNCDSQNAESDTQQAGEPAGEIDHNSSTHTAWFDDIRDYPQGVKLYTAPQPQPDWVPKGWKLVPVEPTKEMQSAYFAAIDSMMKRVEKDPMFGRYESQKRAYKKMLAVAPKRPQSPEGE